MAKASGLRTSTEDLEGFVAERFADETRNNHAVIAGLPGTNRIEKPANDCLEVEFGEVSESQEFINHFAARIAPARKPGRAEDDVSVFLKRCVEALSINFT